MAKAKKLPSGSWRVRVYVGKSADGKNIYRSITAPTKKEAEYKAAEYAVQKKQAHITDKTPFGAAAQNYIEAKANVLSPSTVTGYMAILRALADITDLPIDTLQDSDTVQKLINKSATSHAAKTLKNQYGFISAVLKYNNLTPPQVTLKPAEKRGILVPTKRDAEKILKMIKKYPDIECQILLALTCGLRQSEIAALTPSKINGDKLTISTARVMGANNKLTLKSTPKSKAGNRTVIMPPYLAKRIKKAVAKKKKDDWIFDFAPKQTYQRFRKALAENDLPPYTVHSLRHCFAAILHASNVPDKYVMELGGWSTDNVLRNVYQYTFEEEAQNIQKSVNNYFNKIFDE